MIFLVVLPVAVVLAVSIVWVLTVADHVRMIRTGVVKADDPSVIGAAKWWVTRR